MKRCGGGVALLLALAVGCAERRADRLFERGDLGAAIDAYERHLAHRSSPSADDAPAMLRLAVAYADPDSPRRDPERAKRYLGELEDRFPRTSAGRQAGLLLRALETEERAAGLEDQLRRRDEELAALNAVLRSISLTEDRLRSEVETRDEVRADLEGRVVELTRRAQSLTAEIAELHRELEALKQIDLEGVRQEPP